ncbi:MAG: PilZ domain-containing protein [Planctomycetota bacterium]|nr:MAG: PilZ domain-containing protein [Planctomycetota bacterium]
MKKPHALSTEQRWLILRQAADTRSPVVLSCKTTGGWLTFKSNFLCDISDDGSLTIAHPSSPDYPTPEIVEGQKIGITFRQGHKKFLFKTTVKQRRHDQSNHITSLILYPPADIFEHPRRLYERVLIPQSCKIGAEIWFGDPDNRESQDSTIYRGTIVDVSAGGIGIALPENHYPDCQRGAPVVCSFRVEINRSPLIVQTQFRYFKELDDGSKIMGLQFVGLEAAEKGQAKLERILTLMSRFQKYNKKPIKKHL